ncbi:MAG: hypothetical protein U0521_25140 [Anaerolineae bacterium]
MTVGASDSGWRSGVISITTDGITFTRAKRKWTKACVSRLTGCAGSVVRSNITRAQRNLAALRAGGALASGQDAHDALSAGGRGARAQADRRAAAGHRLPPTPPYVHFGPVAVEPAEEDIHGAWTLDPPITLYLTPLHVVLLRDGQVERLIPLEQVQKVTAMRRIDRPECGWTRRLSDGRGDARLRRENYEALAGAIAEAARRSLEEPLLQKQKGKKDDEDDE